MDKLQAVQKPKNTIEFIFTGTLETKINGQKINYSQLCFKKQFQINFFKLFFYSNIVYYDKTICNDL